MRVTAERIRSVPLHAVLACFLAAGHASAQDARAPSMKATRGDDIAARELSFARKTAANGDFRLSLSLYQRLVDHAPRNRALRTEMEAVAALAPLEIRARFLREKPDTPAGPLPAIRIPAAAPALADAFRESLRAFAKAAPRSAPEARTARPAEAMRAAAPLAAPQSDGPALALRAPRSGDFAQIAPPARMAEARGPKAPANPGAPDLPTPRALAGAAPRSAPEALEPSPAHTARLTAPAAAPRARAPALALRAPRAANGPRITTPTAAQAAIAPRREAQPTLRANAPATLRAAEAPRPKPAAPPAPPEAAISDASPHANDAAPRPSNERAADPAVASDMIAQAAPEPRPRDDMDRLFDALMLDPGNIGLNLRYARAAIDKGEPRKALPAFERVLALDPANAEALAGIARVRADLQPDITQVTVAFGSFYESNPRHFRYHSSHTDAGTLTGRATLFDERRIRDFRWRTEGEAFFSWHTRFHDIDYGLVGLRGGPVLAVGERLRINPFIGGGYAWLKGRSFYLEASGGATFEFEKTLPLHSVSVRAGYNDIGQHISTRDAVFVEVAPRFLIPNLAYQGTALWLSPYWRYNGVIGEGEPGLDQRTEPFPARAHQLGLRIDYFMPVTSKLTVGVNAAYEYRHFFEPVSEGGKNRRDHFVSPGAQAILTGLIDDRFGIMFLYAYEHRFSNDGAQVYSNHLAGMRLLWRN